MQQSPSKDKTEFHTRVRGLTKSIHILTPIVCEYLLSLIISMIFMWGLHLLLMGPLKNHAGWFVENSGRTAVYFDAVATTICAVIFMCWYQKEKRFTDSQVKKISGWKQMLMTVCMLIALSVFLALFLNIVIAKIRLMSSSEAYKNVAEVQYSVSLAFGLINFGLLKPLEEELVFRGLAYGRMRRYFSATVSIPISALLFGVYHGNFVQFIYAFLMGCLLAWAFEKYKSLKASVLVHSSANIVVYIVSSVPAMNKIVFSTVGCAVTVIGAVSMLLWVFRRAKKE